MTQLTDNVFSIPLPKGAESCELRGAHPGRLYPLLSFYGEGEAVSLPPGEYEILVFNTESATEEDARKVVESFDCGFISVYKNYRQKVSGGDFHWAALDSLKSLLLSKSLDDKKNYALIKKKE
jgi:hypothetical protein